MTDHPTRAAVVAASAALLLAGCGGGSSASTEPTTTAAPPSAKLVPARLAQPKDCYLTVFLEDGVTPARKQSVELLLLSSRRVRQIAFVSKELSLKRLAQTQPDVVKGMHVNPYPDEYEVVPRKRADIFAIVEQFAAGVDGVSNLRVNPSCATP